MGKGSGGQDSDSPIKAKPYSPDLSEMETTEDNAQERANSAASAAKSSGGDSDD